MAKRELKNLLILFVFIISINLGFSAIPNYTDKYLNDFAGVFSETQTAELRGLFYAIDTNTTAELVAVTDNECASKGGPSQYAIDILNTWKVGKADKNNGLVALYCKAENKIFISVGYGLEGILPDSKIGRLLDDNYVPLRDSGNVSQGIIAVMEAISNVILENREEVLSGQASPDYVKNIDYFTILIWTFIAYIIISRIVRAIYQNKNKGKNNKNHMPWFLPFFVPFPVRGGSSSGGFSGGSFGGGGFGGGMGGGGGAGR